MSQPGFCEYLWGEPAGRYVSEVAHVPFYPQTSQALGLVRDGRMVAGVIFTEWNGVSMMVHQAVKGRLTRRFLWMVSDYAFRKCGVKKLLGTVTDGNQAAHRLVKHMGFVEEARIEDASPEGAITIYSMRPEQCRFLAEKYEGSSH